jgi:hypothetical protein
MLNKIKPWLWLATIPLVACATVSPPTAQSLAQIPVVRYGEHAPESKPFILLYPAGAKVPVEASLTGTLLEKKEAAVLTATLNKDVYVYQHWVSFDGKTWEDGQHLLESKFVFNLPGEKDGNSPGKMFAEFNLRR